MRYVIANRVSLKIPKLSPDSLRIIGFSDASYANNKDFSQLGHLCFLEHASGAVVLIRLNSYKTKRITRSVMAGEVIAFNDLFDVAAILSEKLSCAWETNSLSAL